MKPRALLVLTALVLASCGGGGGSHATPPVAGSNGTTGLIGSGIPGSLVLTVANGVANASAKRRNVTFVSPGATSAGISIDGSTVTYADVSASSPLCTTTAGARTCTVAVAAPAGNATFAVSLYAGANGGGSLLGSGSGSTTVVAGTPYNVTVGISPVVASLASTTPATFQFQYGTSYQYSLSVVFADPSGQPITTSGSPNFLYPVTVSFNNPHITASPASLTTPGQSLDIIYDGSATVPSTVTSTLTSNGATVYSGTVPIPGLIPTRCNLTPQGQLTVNPNQIVVGPDHKIWWVEQITNQIGRLDPAVGCSSIVHFANSVGGTAFGIASGGDGNIWISTGSNVLGRYSTAGALVGSVGLGAPGTVNARYLATDSNGNVWYINSSFTNQQVGYVDWTTLTDHPYGPPPSNGLGQFSSIALGADNAIWFTEPFLSPTSVMGRVTTPANGTPGTFNENDIPNTSSLISTYPTQIAAGPPSNGNMWVSVFGNSAINQTNQFWAQFAPAAVTSFTEYPNVINAADFANLVTMFLGGDGNMWIAEGGGAVKIPPGNPTGALAEGFNDNGQSSYNYCVAGPDGNNYCATYGGVASGPGFTTTYDAIVIFTPR